MSWTQTFGGKTQRPSQVSFRAIALTGNLTLVWPLNAPPSSEVVADIMDVTPDVGGHVITLPSATEAGVGNNILFRNLGADSFDIVNNVGGAVATVPSGGAYFIYLRSNSTVAGLWGVVFYGVGSTTVDAAGLAGNGLEAISTTLNVDFPIATKNATYSVGVNDRATMLTNTGGTITFNLPPSATVGDGWFIGAINEGSGSLTLDPNGAETIDGQSTKVLAIGESCFVVSDGTNFRTIGYGRSISTTVTALSKDVSGSGTSTMSSTEVAAQVINFTGALTGARIVEFGTGPGYWFVFNNTSGAFTLTARVNGADGGAALTQGNYSIIRSDGTNMRVAFTATSGTVTSVATGTGLTGGPITSTGTISLANTAVAAGGYGTASGAPFVNFTVDAQGRLTAASQTNTSAQNFVIQNASPSLVLNGSGDATVVHQSGGVTRFIHGWSPVSGVFYLNRYNGSGVFQGTPQTWNSTNNDSNFSGSIGVAGNVAAGSMSTTGNLSVSGTSTLSGQVSTFATELVVSNPSFARVRTANSSRAWTVGTDGGSTWQVNDETGVQGRLLIDAGGEARFTGGNGVLRGGGAFYPSSDGNWFISTDGNNMFFSQNLNCYNYYTRTNGNWGWVVNSSTIGELNFANGLGFRSHSNIKAYAWVNVSTITQAMNVSSITFVGTGDYRMVFANALPTTAYTVLSGCEAGGHIYTVGYAQGGVHDQFQVALQTRSGVNTLTNTEWSAAIVGIGL